MPVAGQGRGGARYSEGERQQVAQRGHGGTGADQWRNPWCTCGVDGVDQWGAAESASRCGPGTSSTATATVP